MKYQNRGKERKEKHGPDEVNGHDFSWRYFSGDKNPSVNGRELTLRSSGNTPSVPLTWASSRTATFN